MILESGIEKIKNFAFVSKLFFECNELGNFLTTFLRKKKNPKNGHRKSTRTIRRRFCETLYRYKLSSMKQEIEILMLVTLEEISPFFFWQLLFLND